MERYKSRVNTIRKIVLHQTSIRPVRQDPFYRSLERRSFDVSVVQGVVADLIFNREIVLSSDRRLHAQKRNKKKAY